YMLQAREAIFVEDDSWYLMVAADSKHNRDDYKCGNYADRPNVSRKYTTDECEFEDDAVYDKYFETPEQIWEYAEAVLPDAFPQPRPDRSLAELSLPVLSGVA
ncbi:MAG: YkgJ family cysteine cluster protein, partial [Planctomycetaceae bacterium]